MYACVVCVCVCVCSSRQYVAMVINGVTVVSQRDPMVLHCCYTVVPLLFHCCYTVVTLLLHCCYTVVTLLLHCCYTVVTLFLPVSVAVVGLCEHFEVIDLLVHHTAEGAQSVTRVLR
jgi:hypothetical protein